MCKYSKLLINQFIDTGHTSIVKLFIENGANLSAVNYYTRYSALMMAIERGNNSKKVYVMILVMFALCYLF